MISIYEVIDDRLDMTSGPLSLDEHFTELYFGFYRLADFTPTFLDPRIGRLEMRKVSKTFDY